MSHLLLAAALVAAPFAAFANDLPPAIAAEDLEAPALIDETIPALEEAVTTSTESSIQTTVQTTTETVSGTVVSTTTTLETSSTAVATPSEEMAEEMVVTPAAEAAEETLMEATDSMKKATDEAEDMADSLKKDAE